MLDVDNLLAPISESEPTGPNREYDAPFGELERLGQAKPEQQIGDTVTPGEEPNWRDVLKQSVALLGTTKDLRPALHATRANFRLDGFPGLLQGLQLIRGLIEQYWDTFHPALDPDDDNDPTIRINLLSELADTGTMLAWVRTTPFVSITGFGRFTYRDMLLASGELAAPEGETPTQAADIDKALAGIDFAVLDAMTQAVRGCATTAREIEKLVDERVPSGYGVNLAKLRQPLDKVALLLEKHHVARSGGGDSQTEVTEVVAADGTVVAVATATGRGIDGDIRNRDDVLRVIDKIIEYYDRSEPSSPVPMLLKRARKLATMSFFDILKNLAPASLEQIEVIRGPEEETPQ